MYDTDRVWLARYEVEDLDDLLAPPFASGLFWVPGPDSQLERVLREAERRAVAEGLNVGRPLKLRVWWPDQGFIHAHGRSAWWPTAEQVTAYIATKEAIGLAPALGAGTVNPGLAPALGGMRG